MMRSTLRKVTLAGLLAAGSALGLETTAAQAQVFPPSGYGGGYGISGGCNAYGIGSPVGINNFGNPGGLPYYNPNLPWSPAQQQGWREGRLYYQTGIAPNRPLSPAEAQGFAAGEQRQAATPWQLDPAKQQGWREGQIFWETGLLPNHPLSPDELQGFISGERRAATGGYRPW